MDVALIGLGMVAGTHLAALRDNRQGLRLRGVMARDPARTAAFADRAAQDLGHPVQVYTDLETLTREVDFSILTTPPNARADIVSILAENRVPILMEKPVERTLKSAMQLVETCEATGTPLGIVFQHRMRAASLAAKQAIDAGRLGDIAGVEIRVPWWREQAYYDEPGRGSYARDGGGVMISQAIHTLDLALWLAGPVAEVQAMMGQTPLHNLEAEDWASAALRFASGAYGSLMATTSAYPGAAESLTLHGTQGSAHLQSGVLTLTLRDGTTETHGASATTGGGADPMAFTHDWHQSVIEDFAQALRDSRTPMATGRQALMAHAVIDAMEQSHKTGQRIRIQSL